MFSSIFALSFTTQALIAGIFSFLVTSLGSAVVFFFKKVSKTIMDMMLSLSAGIMLAASFFSLLEPSIEIAKELQQNLILTAFFGFMIGGGFIYVCNILMASLSKNNGATYNLRRCSLLFTSITLHNFPEGLAIGVAFGSLLFGGSIVPAYTYTSTASAAIHCGAKVIFIDIQKNGDSITHAPEMDYEKLEAAITDKTKAIIPVDLGGIVCDYERIFDIVELKRSLFHPLDDHSNPLSDLGSRIQAGLSRVAVVADCAHSLGASRIVSHTGKGGIEKSRRYSGAIADFSSFSFHAVKNFTTAEGGASTWCLPQSVYDNGVMDSSIYKMYQLLSLHGQNKDALDKTKIGTWEYDIIGPWYKCNMTDIMAAIGLRQLDRYPELLKRREEIMAEYDKTCDELGISHLVHHTEYMDSSNHLYLIRVPGASEENRNEIITKVAEAGVATNVHYKPLPMMTAYKESSGGIEQYPCAYDYYRNLITLPLHTCLSDEDVEYVCQTLKLVIKEMNLC